MGQSNATSGEAMEPAPSTPQAQEDGEGARRREEVLFLCGGLLCLVGGILQCMASLKTAGFVAMGMIAVGMVLVLVADSMKQRSGNQEPSILSVASITATVAAVLAVFIVTTSTVVDPAKYTPGMTVWTLAADGQWLREDTTDDAEPQPVASQPSPAAPKGALSSLGFSPSLLLFPDRNLALKQVTHNNILTDTNGADDLPVVGIGIDRGDYNVYGGWIELRNDTGEKVLNADVAVSFLDDDGTLMNQANARLDDPLEPGMTARAFFNVDTLDVAQVQPYTVIWYSAGSDVLPTWGKMTERAAKQATAGTVFHKASPAVPALPVS